MANTTLFNTSKFTAADSTNSAGGPAYLLEKKHALAQLAVTGCFNGTYYDGAAAQLNKLMDLCAAISDNEFIGKLAIYSREKAFMKDMPAALLAILSGRDLVIFHKVFDRIIDNGRMLRTFFQMIRSGKFGRKSLSHSLQRAFQRWFNNASVMQIINSSVGNDPSLRDVLRLARPTPIDNKRRALFGWVADKPADQWVPAKPNDIADEVMDLVYFRLAPNDERQIAHLKKWPFRWDLLVGNARSSSVWKEIARQMSPQALRMNLNTLLRHRVFDEDEMVNYVAARIVDVEEIKRSRQFPYQYLSASLNTSPGISVTIKNALMQAAEIACGNIPELPGPIVIGLDVSGSMSSPITGYRGNGATTKVTCLHVAALFAMAILRRNPGSLLVPFDTKNHNLERVSPEATITALWSFLTKFHGGGTDCSIPLATVNTQYRDRPFIGCVLISDNESWVGTGRHGSTATMTQWQEFVKNQKTLGVIDPKLVCIDLQPNTTTQVPESENVLNVGGFSDSIFPLVSSFFNDEPAKLVSDIESIVM